MEVSVYGVDGVGNSAFVAITVTGAGETGFASFTLDETEAFATTLLQAVKDAPHLTGGRAMKGRTHYSEEIKGSRGNHDLPARYDMTDGFLGINQQGDRVLLSPKQVEELTKFLKAHLR